MINLGTGDQAERIGTERHRYCNGAVVGGIVVCYFRNVTVLVKLFPIVTPIIVLFHGEGGGYLVISRRVSVLTWSDHLEFITLRMHMLIKANFFCSDFFVMSEL